MSVAGISSSNWFDYGSQNVQSQMQKMQQEFEQLGQDLEAGNLSAAQSDFATLQQLSPQASSSSSSASSGSTNTIAQAFSQLAQDLQAGNLSAAQQDYSTIQQDVAANAVQGGHHHHHHGGGGQGNQENSISQLFSQLGQALQSGDLSTAQQVYSTLQQDFQQLGQNNGTTTTESTVTPNAVSVTA